MRIVDTTATVYMHQETDRKNSGGVYLFIYFFNVTGGKGEKKKMRWSSE